MLDHEGISKEGAVNVKESGNYRSTRVSFTEVLSLKKDIAKGGYP